MKVLWRAQPLEIGSLLVMTVGWAGGDDGYWGSIIRDTLQELRFWKEFPHLCELFSMNSPRDVLDWWKWVWNLWMNGWINQIESNQTKSHSKYQGTCHSQHDVAGRPTWHFPSHLYRAPEMRWTDRIGGSKTSYGVKSVPTFLGVKKHQLFSGHLDPGLRNPPPFTTPVRGRFSLGQVPKKAF